MKRENWWLPGLYLDEAGRYCYDGEMTADLFATASGHLGRNDGPALLYDLWTAGAINLTEHPGVVADAWTMVEFPPSKLDPGDWVDLFGEAGYTSDGQPAERPDKPVTVYRGCHDDRRHGMSWTSDLERACWFAARDLGHGTGHVYTVAAEPAWLLAYIGDEHRRESEYVIDPLFLNDSVVSLVLEVDEFKED